MFVLLLLLLLLLVVVVCFFPPNIWEVLKDVGNNHDEESRPFCSRYCYRLTDGTTQTAATGAPYAD